MMTGDRDDADILRIDGVEVRLSHPQKLLIPSARVTKRDVADYFVHVAPGALAAAGGRPHMLVRYPNGIDRERFFQKRAPAVRPPWVEVVTLTFPSGRTADEVVPRSGAALAWLANLACLELHAHPVRADDLDHPDELRVDLDPVAGVPWQDVVRVARVVEETLARFALVGWPKTSGSRGLHVYARIRPRWGFDEVRRAALALAREVERAAPAIATSKWWKEERHGVFVDYNQNAKDRTIAAAYSIRPRPDARVSTPIRWEELDDCDPADFTIRTIPARFDRLGHVHAGMDAAAGSLDGLLELSARHAREGLGDAPWPPQYARQPDEPPRVQPSRRRSSTPPAAKGSRPTRRTRAKVRTES